MDSCHLQVDDVNDEFPVKQSGPTAVVIIDDTADADEVVYCQEATGNRPLCNLSFESYSLRP